MDFIMKYWAENANYEELKKRVDGRRIAVWGAYAGGKQIKHVLSEHGLKVSFYIDGHKDASEYDSLPIIKPSSQIDRNNMYIFVAVIGVRGEIVHYLNEWGMQEDKDYTYISKSMPHFTISNCSSAGMTCNDNSLECADEEIECSIEFIGFGSKVKIGRRFQASEQTRIMMESGSNLVIGDDVTLCGNISLEVSAGGLLKIGNNCRISAGTTIRSKGSYIDLGDYVTVGERFFCINGKSTSVSIGNDCMFSNDVSVMSGGHSIYDLKTKENVSMKQQKYVKIGNHVWIGKNAVILHNAEIGNGCIVGAASVVKIATGENCIIAGNPAKVIKTDHTWDRRNDIEFEDI